MISDWYAEKTDAGRIRIFPVRYFLGLSVQTCFDFACLDFFPAECLRRLDKTGTRAIFRPVYCAARPEAGLAHGSRRTRNSLKFRRMGFQREGRLCKQPFPLTCLSSDSFRTNGKNRPPEGKPENKHHQATPGGPPPRQNLPKPYWHANLAVHPRHPIQFPLAALRGTARGRARAREP